MNITQLILRSLRHYAKSNWAIAAGVAVATAVICGALIVGDSLSESLIGIVQKRLGNTTHVLTAGDRIFSSSLAERLDSVSGFPCAPVLKTEAVLSTDGGDLKLNQVQVWGVDGSFAGFSGVDAQAIALEDAEIQVSETVAKALNVHVGDEMMLRMKHVGPIPSNTPFVSDEQALISKRVVVQSILPADSYGLMHLASSQSQPYNVFVNLDWLNQVTDNEHAANLLLIESEKDYPVDELQKACEKAILPEDLNVIASENGALKLTSQRVFMESDITDSIVSNDRNAEVYLTYFVNTLSVNGLQTPYSFVSATNRYPNLKKGDMFINEWMARDLRTVVGDSLTMKYFVFGSLRTLKEVEQTFRISGIVSMSASVKDSVLMPYLPGLSDAGNCRDWKTGIPIDLKKIRDKDESYWKQYKGSPKAYISLAYGQELWYNVYGNATNIFLKNPPEWAQILHPFEQGFVLKPVLKEGLVAAESGVDFSQLFAGLGMFVIAAGLILTILLLNLSLKQRKPQIYLLNALGFSKSRIRNLMLIEVAFVATLGGLLGLLLSIGYSKLVFWGLNHIWFDMVRTDALTLSFHVGTLLSGCFIGIVVGILSVIPTLNKSVASLKHEQQKKTRSPLFSRNRLWLSLLCTCVIIFMVLMVLQWWLPAGLMLLTGLLVAVIYLLNSKEKRSLSPLQQGTLIVKSVKRNALGSFVAVLLLALGTFAIVVTASNKKNAVLDTKDETTGTGGFEQVAQTTIPLLYDLNAGNVRSSFGIPDSIRFVQFLSAYDDDASCLNLNVVANPKILAADPSDLQGRFKFVSQIDGATNANGWALLNQSFEGEVIPAVVDETVLVWGLGKKIGDTLHYVNVRGEKIHLLLVGGLASSVFQGHVLISKANFLKHFYENGGSDFMLIDALGSENPELWEELNFVFKEYGWNSVSTVQKLAEFNSIENTYLNVFFLMGAFAMLLGTIGFAIHVIGSLVERKKETALLKALGFRPKKIFGMFALEFFTLFISGTFIGLISAVVASFQTFLDGNETIDLTFLCSVLIILILNGICWIVLFAHKASKDTVSWKNLRND